MLTVSLKVTQYNNLLNNIKKAETSAKDKRYFPTQSRAEAARKELQEDKKKVATKLRALKHRAKAKPAKEKGYMQSTGSRNVEYKPLLLKDCAARKSVLLKSLAKTLKDCEAWSKRRARRMNTLGPMNFEVAGFGTE